MSRPFYHMVPTLSKLKVGSMMWWFVCVLKESTVDAIPALGKDEGGRNQAVQLELSVDFAEAHQKVAQHLFHVRGLVEAAFAAQLLDQAFGLMEFEGKQPVRGLLADQDGNARLPVVIGRYQYGCFGPVLFSEVIVCAARGVNG